jgi:hypothetical protein
MLHNEELHKLYLSPNIIRQFKSRKMRWAGHVARMGEWRTVHRVLVGNQKEREHFEDQGIDGKVGSEWILRRLGRSIEWIELAQDRGRWRALVNTVMNLRVLVPRS